MLHICANTEIARKLIAVSQIAYVLEKYIN